MDITVEERHKSVELPSSVLTLAKRHSNPQLYKACSSPQGGKLALLLLSNAKDEIDILTDEGGQLLVTAYESRLIDVVNAILKTNKNNITKSKGVQNLFSVACTDGDTDLIDALLNCKADVNGANENGETMIALTVMSSKADHIGITKKLLEHAASVELKHITGLAPGMPCYCCVLGAGLIFARVLLVFTYCRVGVAVPEMHL